MIAGLIFVYSLVAIMIIIFNALQIGDARTDKDKQYYARWTMAGFVWPLLLPYFIIKGIHHMWGLMFIYSGKPELFKGHH